MRKDGMYKKLLLIMSECGFQRLGVPGRFLALAGDFGPPTGTERLFGNRHPHRVRQCAHRFREAGGGVFHQELDGGAMRAATEAMVELLGRTDGERRRFFVVKRAQAKQVGPALAQLHVAPDDVDNIDAGEQILEKRLWDHMQSAGQPRINTGAAAIADCECACSDA